MQIFISFNEGQLKQQICYIFSLLISHMVFNPLKWQSSNIRLYQIFPILMVQMLFPPNSTGPWPQLQKGRKIPVVNVKEENAEEIILDHFKVTFRSHHLRSQNTMWISLAEKYVMIKISK